MQSLGKVFMLDDDIILINLYRRLLKSYGYDFFASDNVFEFLQYTKEIMPDVILLDINMPHLNGWDVLDIFRQDMFLKDIPIVMQSVLREDDLAVVKGAAHFLHKPLEPQILFDLVQTYCIGNRKDDILFLDSDDVYNSFFKRSILQNRLKIFSVYSLAGAKKYLLKNTPTMICCYNKRDFDLLKSEFVWIDVKLVNPYDDIQNFFLHC